jgi:hypothetical protein
MTVCAFFRRFDFVDSFCATGLSGVQVAVPVVDEVALPVELDVVVFDVVVSPDWVVVVAPPFVFADAEFPFGVVDFADFVVAPVEVVVLGVADELFPLVVWAFTAAADPVAVVALGP